MSRRIRNTDPESYKRGHGKSINIVSSTRQRNNRFLLPCRVERWSTADLHDYSPAGGAQIKGREKQKVKIEE